MHTIWSNILSDLEWLSRYGFIDIIFGIGVITFLWRVIRRHWPRNLPGLQIDTRLDPPPHVTHVEIEGTRRSAIFIIITNVAAANVYITKASFRAYYRRLLFWKWKTKLRILPVASKDIQHKEYELKFVSRYQWYPESSSSIHSIRKESLSSNRPISRESSSCVVAPLSGFVQNIPLDPHSQSRSDSFIEPINEFDVRIRPYERTYTFLPLLEQTNQATLDSRKCGKVILHYLTSDGKGGKHVLRI